MWTLAPPPSLNDADPDPYFRVRVVLSGRRSGLGAGGRGAGLRGGGRTPAGRYWDFATEPRGAPPPPSSRRLARWETTTAGATAAAPAPGQPPPPPLPPRLGGDDDRRRRGIRALRAAERRCERERPFRDGAAEEEEGGDGGRAKNIAPQKNIAWDEIPAQVAQDGVRRRRALLRKLLLRQRAALVEPAATAVETAARRNNAGAPRSAPREEEGAEAAVDDGRFEDADEDAADADGEDGRFEDADEGGAPAGLVEVIELGDDDDADANDDTPDDGGSRFEDADEGEGLAYDVLLLERLRGFSGGDEDLVDEDLADDDEDFADEEGEEEDAQAEAELVPSSLDWGGIAQDYTATASVLSPSNSCSLEDGRDGGSPSGGGSPSDLRGDAAPAGKRESGQPPRPATVPEGTAAAVTASRAPDDARKPKRHLSAYNLFFRYERVRILSDVPIPDAAAASASFEERLRAVRSVLHNNPFPADGRRTKRWGRRPPPHGEIGFREMVRAVAARWRAADDATRRVFNRLSKEDRDRCNREMAAWRGSREAKAGAESGGELPGKCERPTKGNADADKNGAARIHRMQPQLSRLSWNARCADEETRSVLDGLSGEDKARRAREMDAWRLLSLHGKDEVEGKAKAASGGEPPTPNGHAEKCVDRNDADEKGAARIRRMKPVTQLPPSAERRQFTWPLWNTRAAALPQKVSPPSSPPPATRHPSSRPSAPQMPAMLRTALPRAKREHEGADSEDHAALHRHHKKQRQSLPQIGGDAPTHGPPPTAFDLFIAQRVELMRRSLTPSAREALLAAGGLRGLVEEGRWSWNELHPAARAVLCKQFRALGPGERTILETRAEAERDQWMRARLGLTLPRMPTALRARPSRLEPFPFL